MKLLIIDVWGKGKMTDNKYKEPPSYNEYHKQYEEGRREANYNRNPYPIGSKEYNSFNQGVCSVLDLSND